MENNLTNNITKKYKCATCLLSQPLNAYYSKNRTKCKRCIALQTKADYHDARNSIGKRDNTISEVNIKIIEDRAHFTVNGKIISVERATTQDVALRTALILDLVGMEHFMMLTKNQEITPISDLR